MFGNLSCSLHIGFFGENVECVANSQTNMRVWVARKDHRPCIVTMRPRFAQQVPRLANNSFKPTPLRGAAELGC